jgi:hypothetical protein
MEKLSLRPLKFREAVSDILKAKPEPKRKSKAKAKQKQKYLNLECGGNCERESGSFCRRPRALGKILDAA